MSVALQTTKVLLVVEDNAIEREGLTAVLRGAGYSVSMTANGAEALEFLDRFTAPQLILLDMLTPVLDGWHFLIRRKEQPRLQSIPIIVMTGLEVASASWAHALGAVGFLQKPIDPDQLFQEIERCRHS
jgi:two-component system chemotaxis response regulator CheY